MQSITVFAAHQRIGYQPAQANRLDRINAHLTTSDARKAGEGERRLSTVAVWRETPFFTDIERAALDWTESVNLVASSRVPDDVWNRVNDHFTPAEMVDLTLLVNTINAWNRFPIAFRKLPL